MSLRFRKTAMGEKCKNSHHRDKAYVNKFVSAKIPTSKRIKYGIGKKSEQRVQITRPLKISNKLSFLSIVLLLLVAFHVGNNAL